MMIFKVIGEYDNRTRKVIHKVKVYELFDIIYSFFFDKKNPTFCNLFKYDFIFRFKKFIAFFERCYLSENKANNVAKKLDSCRDLEW